MESHGFVDGLFDFSSEDEEDKPQKVLPSLNPNYSDPVPFNALDPDDPSHSFSEFVEEDLEWISNKDAFPGVETFVDILASQPNISRHQNTVSMTEYSTNSANSNNSSTLLSCYDHLKVPVRARSKRRSRCHRGIADISSKQFWWSQMDTKFVKTKPIITISTIGRKCQHCGAEKTPQWRAGPLGPKTLCNACGVRYTSGRLLPEYRPASSPTFSSELHSNSHRKIVEMRRQKRAGSLKPWIKC